MFPSDQFPKKDDQPTFGGIGKFGPAAGAPAPAPFEGAASADPADEEASGPECGEGDTDVVTRGLRLLNLIKRKD
jgi:hypothetical protein